jgi:hypothetical protein
MDIIFFTATARFHFNYCIIAVAIFRISYYQVNHRTSMLSKPLVFY